LAHAFSALDVDMLAVTGAVEGRALRLPHRTDVVSLPALKKNADGTYGPMRLSASIGELITLRSRIITAGLEAFRPDVLIVDKVARGAFGELEPALEALAGRTRVVLGLRDVLDAKDVAREEWWRDATTEAIAEFYDAVWIYGDRRVFDVESEYGLPESVAGKVRYTGYLASARPVVRVVPEEPYALCMVGGGQDGAPLMEAFLRADAPGLQQVAVTGPYMPAEERSRLEEVARRRGHRLIEFTDDPLALMMGASRVVGMGGYNFTVELLSLDVPALVVPRVRPRREQLVRAQRLAALGAIETLEPEHLSPAALTAWLSSPPRRRADHGVDLNGLETACRFLAAELAAAEVNLAAL